jgi:hypothetical protein
MSKQNVFSPQTGSLWMGFAGLLLLMAAMAIDSARAVQKSRFDKRGHCDGSCAGGTLFSTACAWTSSTPEQSSVTTYWSAMICGRKRNEEELQRVQLQINDTLRSYEECLSGSEKQALKPLQTPMDSILGISISSTALDVGGASVLGPNISAKRCCAKTCGNCPVDAASNGAQ